MPKEGEDACQTASKNFVLSAGLAGTPFLFWAFEGGIFGGGDATPLWVYPALVWAPTRRWAA